MVFNFSQPIIILIHRRFFLLLRFCSEKESCFFSLKKLVFRRSWFPKVMIINKALYNCSIMQSTLAEEIVGFMFGCKSEKPKNIIRMIIERQLNIR